MFVIFMNDQSDVVTNTVKIVATFITIVIPHLEYGNVIQTQQS